MQRLQADSGWALLITIPVPTGVLVGPGEEEEGNPIEGCSLSCLKSLPVSKPPFLHLKDGDSQAS